MKAFILSFVTMMAAALAIQHEYEKISVEGSMSTIAADFQPEFVFIKGAHQSAGSFTGTGSDDRIISFHAVGFERPPIGETEY